MSKKIHADQWESTTRQLAPMKSDAGRDALPDPAPAALTVQRARSGGRRLHPSEVLQLQRSLGNRATLGLLTPEPAPTRTNLPDSLRSGLEHLSGVDLSGVRVHYNSAKPAQLNALAYTQGQDIHVAPGQEKHLPHEGWHVVQQFQGRVRPTVAVNGQPINDSPGLEAEADRQGTLAADVGGSVTAAAQLRAESPPQAAHTAGSPGTGAAPIQRVGVTHAVAGPVAVVGGGQLRINIICTLASGGPAVQYAVTTSEAKHLLQSYREMNVTTGNSGINTNTIARINRAQFRAAFADWANACATALTTHGTTWVPSSLVHMTPQGISFSSDGNGSTNTIHSFPVGGTVSVLTDAQFDLLKEAARACYRHGNYQTAADRVANVLGTPARTGDVNAVVALLGMTVAELTERVNSITETTAYTRDEDRWMNSFVRMNLP